MSFRIFPVVLILSSLLCACSQREFGLLDESQVSGQEYVYNNKVDIILMVDNSPSMSQYHQRLSDQMPNLISQLDSLSLDYHIVVVTSDISNFGNGGEFLGSPMVITRNTVNRSTVLAQRILSVGVGSDLEQGLESIKRALDPGYLAGAGAGFFRSEALLSIVALSTEDDYSAGNVNTHASRLDALKPALPTGARSWVLNFIGVPSLSSTCTSGGTGGSYRESGVKWIDLAQRSGGLIEEVCSANFGTAIRNIQKRVVQIITDYSLTRDPVVATIQVSVNGVSVPQDSTNGWSYHPDIKVIRFNGSSVPPSGARVVIDYTPAGAL